MKSLRVRLLIWVLLPMLGALALSAWLSWRSARDMAVLRQDRTLLASAEVMAERIQWANGELAAHTPLAALAMFASTAHDRVYFEVRDASGNLLAGWPGLISDHEHPALGVEYGTLDFNGERVRAVTLTRALRRRGQVLRASVRVAEGRIGFNRLLHALWWPTLQRESALLAFALLLMLLGLTLELRPVLDLRRRIEQRAPDDLTPIDPTELDLELRPVVETLNQYALRLTQQVEAQKRFVMDAAHQLRTPVALLNAQLDVLDHAEVSPDVSETHEAMRACARRQRLLINQLLALFRVEAHDAQRTPAVAVDLLVPVRRSCVELALFADAKRLELEVDAPNDAVMVLGHAALLQSMVFNLLDNAVRYAPEGGFVRACVRPLGDVVELCVEDNGPGIAPSRREAVFERFNRGDNSDDSGFGLGLAIVREAVRGCGAQLTLGDGPHGQGLRVTVRLRAAPSHPAA
ncbi:sensor histidine kinase [Thiomonas sp.]|uniref:sensor histidine kinase n=1 Tax=Thiomonas sp. TaxID=2047785 RepID=UPI00262835D7|nr:sensor histidine kinase [Thiomonas sp.]